MSIRAVIADNCPHVLTMLRLTLELEPGIDVVGEAADGLEAIEQARVLQPDVVVLDLEMPRLSGLDALPAIRGVAPATKVVVCSARERAIGERLAFDRGASAYLDKTELDELVAVVLLVCSAELVYVGA